MATETDKSKNKITNLIMLHDALVTINFFWQINQQTTTKFFSVHTSTNSPGFPSQQEIPQICTHYNFWHSSGQTMQNLIHMFKTCDSLCNVYGQWLTGITGYSFIALITVCHMEYLSPENKHNDYTYCLNTAYVNATY